MSVNRVLSAVISIIYVLMFAGLLYAGNSNMAGNEPVLSIKLDSRFEVLPASKNKQVRISAIVRDPDDSFFLLDSHSSEILHYSSQGKILSRAGGFGFGEASMRAPSDMAMIGFELWIADPPLGRISRFDRRLAALAPYTGKSANSFGSFFDRPVSIASAPRGDVVLIDEESQEALFVDSKGILVDRFAEYGKQAGGLQNPVKTRVSSTGTVAVLDASKNSVLLYDSFGSFEREIKPHHVTDMTAIAWFKSKLVLAGDNGIEVQSRKGAILCAWPLDLFEKTPVAICVYGTRLAVSIGSEILIFTIQQD